MNIQRGWVVVVQLNPAIGHEQRGVRPCVIVSEPAVVSQQRFALVCVVPMTGTSLGGPLYPRVESGESGLTKTSWALTDQLRSIDNKRILGVLGELSAPELAAIDFGLAYYLGLG